MSNRPGSNARKSRLSAAESKFFGRCKGQPAFAVEKFLQALVFGTAFAADDFGGHAVSEFAAKAPAFEPVFPTHYFKHWNGRDF